VLSSLSLTSAGVSGRAAVQERRPAPSGPTPLASRRPPRSSPPAAEEVPAWARSTPNGSAPGAGPALGTATESYRVEPDFGHAELGEPSASSRGGTARANANEPGSVSLTPSRGDESSGNAEAGKRRATWRSEARAFARRTRALSRELGRRERTNDPASSESASQEDRAPAEASTASGTGSQSNAGPDTPNDPNQVPLGGTGWLAVAGGAYALNRLREENVDEDTPEGDA